MSLTINSTVPTYHTSKLSNGVEIFYREVGNKTQPRLLLLQGFPTSSRQFDALLILLSPYFYIVAPDLPSFGLTTTPKDYNFNFDNIADTIDLFLDTIKFDDFSIYIFDYGAPTGLRLAINSNKKINAIVSQNGNAYEEGFGEDFWSILYRVWDLADQGDFSSEEFLSEKKKIVAALVSIEGFSGQYVNGEPDSSRIDPELAWIDLLLLQNRPNAAEEQFALVVDYRKNVKLYPEFHKYFEKTNIPILAVWGKNDPIFVKEGAHAYKKDSKNVKVVEIDGGHFAGITHAKEVAQEILDFFVEYKLI